MEIFRILLWIMLKNILTIKTLKIMNRKILTTVAFVLLLLCSCFVCQAQMVDITTPNGSPVTAEIGVDPRNDSTKAALDSSRIAEFPNAILKDSSTAEYNCHGYAWSMANNGPLCTIIGYVDLHWFWDDYSYLESTEDDYDIIYYDGGEEDHSVIKSIYTQGKYISKWGGWAFNGT